MSTPELSTAEPSAAPIDFFRNYNRLIGFAYAAILVGLAAFFGLQLQQKLEAEIALIEAGAHRHSQLVEMVMRASGDHLETLRMMAYRPDDGQALPFAALPLPSWQGFTRHDEGGAGGFSLDGVLDRDMSGNLVGLGEAEGRSVEFERDIHLAQVLNAGFRSMIFTMPNAASVRFISTERFMLTVPWRPSSALAFSDQVYDGAVWKGGRPQDNPDREKYWAPVYFGGKDQGLLVPMAAPVYDQGRFAGVLAMDTSLDYLNRLYGDFPYALGTALLVDAHRQVLAHPQWYADPLSVEHAPMGYEVLPEALSALDWDALPQNRHVLENGYLVIAHHFVSAPWTQLYLVPKSALWKKVLQDHGLAMLVTLLGLAGVMVITYWVTSREFVGPASKLVRHLAAESRFLPTQIPVVPSAWRPWFETVTRAFRESIQLMALRQELDVAARMQSAILPHAWPSDPRYRLWGTMQAAKEVGGDFYDHFEVGEGLHGVVVADVSGKGIGPGLFGVMAKTLMRATATQAMLSVSEVMEKVNNELCRDNEDCTFVTLFYGLFDPATGCLRYVNAGHLPPLLIHADGSVVELDGDGDTAAGILPGLPYAERTVTLSPGDTLLMFSDGVNEAMNAQDALFGTERLLALFEGKAPTSPEEAVQRTVDAVHAFADGVEQSDDITCVALCLTPDARS
jgi:sigma-B regulation protein RsbU (phosphoserine phosphatase)